jgi:hypothetical protein
MKLTRIRLEQFKQFRQALEISGLDDGINLFTGPNEAGKSTVVAAIRAAFFERYRSSTADEFRPWNEPSASPEVEVEFDHNGEHYRLAKRFLGKKRCDLQIGTRILDGADAEDHLAALMGFQHAGKGASKADHWGIPGLLWIQQGSAQDVRESVAHATGHLRTALNGSLGEVASSHGDGAIAKVELARGELLSPATGKPRAAYLAAQQREVELAAAVSEILNEIATYRQKVDRLTNLRVEHAADEAERPWLQFREDEKAAVEKLRATQEITDRMADEKRRAQQTDTRVTLLRGQLETYLAEERAVQARQADLTKALQAEADAVALVKPWTRKQDEAEHAERHARYLLAAVRREEQRRSLAREHHAVQRGVEDAVDALAAAQTQQARLAEHEQKAAALAIAAKDLQTLRYQHQALRDLRSRMQGVATRLRFSLDAGRSMDVGGVTVSGSGEQLLLDATALSLPGLGRLHIEPGGADLASLRREEAELGHGFESLLQRLGVATLDAAEQRQQAHAALLAEATIAAATLKGLAPRGVDALRTSLAAGQARLADLAQALLAMPSTTVPGPSQPLFPHEPAGAGGVEDIRSENTRLEETRVEGIRPEGIKAAGISAEVIRAEDVKDLSVHEAEAAAASREEFLKQANASLHAAQLRAQQSQGQVQAARRELASAETVVQADGRTPRVDAAKRDLTDAVAEQSVLRDRVAALETQVAQARPEILQQDIERLRRSAEQHERRYNERRDTLMRLEVELQAAGAQGLDERHAELQRDHEQAQRQAQELGRRARALDYLLGLLHSKRSALTQRLQAPLQQALDRYVRLLFPQGSVAIDEDLMLGALTRPGAHGPQASAFDSLSFGAREQMGVISRLAYADLLRDAGMPTLIILDDALVHSDAERLAQMKRVLFDAGTRHQVLLFTCHPANWRDLGVAPRSLAGAAS